MSIEKVREENNFNFNQKYIIVFMVLFGFLSRRLLYTNNNFYYLPAHQVNIGRSQIQRFISNVGVLKM